MRFFRRGPKRDPRDAPRDAAFGFFSEAEGRRLRGLVRGTFAERGLEVTVYADHVRDSTGRRFNLFNLAATCHNSDDGVRAWPDLIRRHIDTSLAVLAGPSPLETLTPDEIRPLLHARLIAEENLPDPAVCRYARSPVPGLRELLALDLPDSVQTLTDDQVTALGDTGAYRLRALNNLRALPVEEHDVIRHEDGTRLDLVIGDSFFTASRALVLDDLVRRVTGEPLGEDGALVCFPFRHLLAFHVIQGPDIVPSLLSMATFAPARFEEAPGPVSPYVYWWRNGAFTQLTTIEGDAVRVTVDGDFQWLLERLVGGAGGAGGVGGA